MITIPAHGSYEGLTYYVAQDTGKLVELHGLGKLTFSRVQALILATTLRNEGRLSVDAARYNLMIGFARYGKLPKHRRDQIV